MAFKVVSLFDLPTFPQDAKAYEAAGIEFVLIPCTTEDEVIAAACDADGVVSAIEPMTEKVIGKLERCKLIMTPKAGIENIDVAAATKHGICVANAGDYAKEEVSDHAMALLLGCARKIVRLDRAVHAGKWDTLHGPKIKEVWVPMYRIKGQTLGIIGFGAIGRTLAVKAKCFGLKVIVYDPFVSKDVAEELGVDMVELDHLISESDFISLHSALTTENRHMLGLEEFRKMKSTAYLINTARGELIDEKALQTALSEGLIAGAGLDVLEAESCSPDNPFLKMDNVIITAHSAFFCMETPVDLAIRRPVMEMTRMMNGEWPNGFVNPEVKEKFQEKWQKRT